jgi:hypothetical protein
METIVIDSKTLIVKSDDGGDLLGIIEFVNQKKDKRDAINSFLTFASKNRIEANGYKFNREDCYVE